MVMTVVNLRCMLVSYENHGSPLRSLSKVSDQVLALNDETYPIIIMHSHLQVHGKDRPMQNERMTLDTKTMAETTNEAYSEGHMNDTRSLKRFAKSCP